MVFFLIVFCLLVCLSFCLDWLFWLLMTLQYTMGLVPKKMGNSRWCNGNGAAEQTSFPADLTYSYWQAALSGVILGFNLCIFHPWYLSFFLRLSDRWNRWEILIGEIGDKYHVCNCKSTIALVFEFKQLLAVEKHCTSQNWTQDSLNTTFASYFLMRITHLRIAL